MTEIPLHRGLVIALVKCVYGQTQEKITSNNGNSKCVIHMHITQSILLQSFTPGFWRQQTEVSDELIALYAFNMKDNTQGTGIISDVMPVVIPMNSQHNLYTKSFWKIQLIIKLNDYSTTPLVLPSKTLHRTAQIHLRLKQ